MVGKDELQAIKEHGEGWYEAYLKRDNTTRTLVLTARAWPNVLIIGRSIYPQKAIYDSLTSEAKAFYESRGINTIVVGPEGLGGGEAVFHIIRLGTEVMRWIRIHWDLLATKILPLALKIRHSLMEADRVRKLKALRSERLGVKLVLCLYIDEKTPCKDLIPYAEQLLMSALELSGILDKKLPYLNIRLDCEVKDSSSQKSVNVIVGEFSIKNVAKVIKKLNSQDPDLEHIKLMS